MLRTPEPATVRPLELATLVTTFGNGLLVTISAVYFTRIVGLTTTQVGLGLTIAGFCGMLAGVPLGHFSDRLGPRESVIAMLIAMTPLGLVLALVGNFWAFAAVSSGLAVFDAGSRAARDASIAFLIPADRRARVRSRLRVLTNVSLAVGAAVATIALDLGTASAYKTLIVIDACTYAIAGLALIRLPRVPRIEPRDASPMWSALRDVPYLGVVILNGFLTLDIGILEVAMPLWIVDDTHAPRTLISILFVINTVAVVLFQMKVSTLIKRPSAAANAARFAGFLLLASCVLFAAAHGLPRAAAIAILLAASIVHVTGEILQFGGWFMLSFDLAPPTAQGQYQGLAGAGVTFASMVAPTAMVLIPIGLGAPGWIIIGIVFAAAGTAMVPAVAWAERTRPRDRV